MFEVFCQSCFCVVLEYNQNSEVKIVVNIYSYLGITAGTSRQKVLSNKPGLLLYLGYFDPGDSLLVGNSVGNFDHYPRPPVSTNLIG